MSCSSENYSDNEKWLDNRWTVMSWGWRDLLKNGIKLSEETNNTEEDL